MGQPRERGSPGLTRGRILEVSRRRFNEEGLHSVAIYRVAAELGISQGNLTYHFKTKVDLALQLVDAFEAELREAAAPFLDVPRADRVLVLLERVLIVLWRYRFLLTAPNYLASIDPQLEQRFRLVHENVRLLMRSNTTSLVSAGAMRAPTAKAAELIADNMVAVWMAWLQLHGGTSAGQPEVPSRAMLLDCFEHHFSLLEPHVSEAFIIELRRALDQYQR